MTQPASKQDLENAEKHVADKLDQISKRVEHIEEKTFLGNGHPSLTARLSNLELQVRDARSTIDKISDNVALLPIIRAEIEALKNLRTQDHNDSVIYKSSRIGGAYQVFAALLTIVLGAFLGAYATTATTEKDVQEMVKRVLTQQTKNISEAVDKTN